MSAKKAIEIAKKTGKLTEAMDEALRGHRVHDLTEEFISQQTQVWFAPNQNALNQFILRLEDKIPDATYSVSDSDNGNIAGFSITVSGTYMPQDLASLAANFGLSRLDGPNQDLSPKA
jgi:hypothetical protein